MIAPDVSALEAALAAAEVAVDDLIVASGAVRGVGQGDELAGLSDDDVLAFAIRVERLRNRMAVLDRPVIAAAEARQIAEKRMMRNTAVLLSDTLRITRIDARRRTEAAAALSASTSMTGDLVPPRFLTVAALQNDGVVSPEQVRVMIDGLARASTAVGSRPTEGADPVGPEQLDWAERTVCENARLFDARELNRVVDTVIDCLKPDGEPDRTEAQRRLRRLALSRMSDGMWRIAGELLPETGAQLAALLGPLARRRPSDPNGDRLHGEDDRDHGQRMHDALGEVAARVINSGDLPVSGGTPTTLVVTIDEDSLRRRCGVAVTSDGSRLPVETVLRMADQAEIIPTVLGTGGAVLTQGRARRIATPSQTWALYARDGGCSFPGCRQPPEWCDRHHVVGWEHGGPTDLDNLTLVCSYHHYRFDRHGWTCSMIDGLPHWTAPPQLDPGQTPQLHHRIRKRVVAQTRARARAATDPPIASVAESALRTMIKNLGPAPRQSALDRVIGHPPPERDGAPVR